MSKRSKKKEEDIWEDYEPDCRDLAAHLQAQKEWKKEILISVWKMLQTIMQNCKARLKEENNEIYCRSS